MYRLVYDAACFLLYVIRVFYDESILLVQDGDSELVEKSQKAFSKDLFGIMAMVFSKLMTVAFIIKSVTKFVEGSAEITIFK